MRNWNTAEGPMYISEDGGFESTYEELKPSLLGNWTKILFSFESTYEELKHGKSINNLFNIDCFESTYEELKQKPKNWTIAHVWKFWVYLWGIETKFRTILKYNWLWFWVYLWGIETYIYFNLLIYGFLFWVYLWGIETWKMAAHDAFDPRFESTYEELKQKWLI